ncbi:hypothetical protein [Nitrosomonas ureae]|uniref:Uncharacterized protein n=1 Tax=Nitrosomonas ureae TaxID=44577 RepID=A0A286A375_9PROT|nr:hypothetical protein [Nitrosomonas ureae]SOD16347.1 hypothetical protein SAMN06297164_0415 [Nitrosomonas ureae]
MLTKQFKCFTHTALATALLLGLSQNVLSHTRLEIPVGVEGVRITNNVVISHGCGDGTFVTKSSVVFPDGVDSIVKVNGTVATDTIDAHVVNWGNLFQKVLDPSVFKAEDEKTDDSGNVVGFYVKDGKMPDHYASYLKFRAGAVLFEPTSCASSVKIVLAIADICKPTTIAGFAEGKLNLWTPAVGSDYDGPGLHGFDSPATYTVTRDLAKNPLPGSCSATGDTVDLIPSAAQINRDLPIKNMKGVQIWPKP